MTVMTPSKCGRDGPSVGVEFLLELVNGGIRRFAYDDGEVRMREG
jgi:hypothetical protein